MNYFLLAETEFFRRINEAGDCNMETAYTAFATQVIELCSGNVDTNRTIIALAYIEIELQHHPVRNLPEEKREVATYISKALSFVRKMQKFLAAPQVPPLIPIRTSSDNTTENPASPLQWTGNAIDLVELIYGINEMGCINNGNMPSISSPRSCTRYSAWNRRTATASTSISNAVRTRAAPTSLTGCRRNSTRRCNVTRNWNA